MVYAVVDGYEAVHEKDWIVPDFDRFEFITKGLCIQRAAIPNDRVKANKAKLGMQQQHITCDTQYHHITHAATAISCIQQQQYHACNNSNILHATIAISCMQQ